MICRHYWPEMMSKSIPTNGFSGLLDVWQILMTEQWIEERKLVQYSFLNLSSKQRQNTLQCTFKEENSTVLSRIVTMKITLKHFENEKQQYPVIDPTLKRKWLISKLIAGTKPEVYSKELTCRTKKWIFLFQIKKLSNKYIMGYTCLPHYKNYLHFLCVVKRENLSWF